MSNTFFFLKKNKSLTKVVNTNSIFFLVCIVKFDAKTCFSLCFGICSFENVFNKNIITMTTREILTFQFGHYSNYVGAHFWNIHELSFDYTGTVKTEVNHDILYREGQTAQGEVTYTPRLLLADLMGSLKTLPASGGLLDDSENVDLQWEPIERVAEPALPKNEYLTDLDTENPPTKEKEYNLEQEVKSWTDFLYPRLHSRTVNIVNEYHHGNENVSIILLYLKISKLNITYYK